MYDEDELNRVFFKADGVCYYCEKQLSFSNYGQLNRRGAWEVEHIVPLSEGGQDNRRNRIAACVSCNRQKGSKSAKQFRRKHFDSNSGGDGLGAFLLVLAVLTLFGWFAGNKR